MANKITDETIDYVGILAKLELSDEEKEKAKKDMGEILDYIDKLNELDTSGVEPMSHVFPVNNVFREDEVTNGYTLVNLLLENGDRNVGLEAWTVGDATFQLRWKGYQQAIDEWNAAHADDPATITEPVYANTSSEEGAAAAMSLYNSNPGMDALIVAGGGGDPLVGSIGAYANEGLTGKIDVVSTDFLDDLADQLKSGGMFAESGGHFCDPLFAFYLVLNAVKGNYVKEEGTFGYEILFPYLYVSSPDDYANYEKYFVNDDPYTDEELVEMASYSFEDLNKAASNLSINDVISRHSN